MDAFGQGDDPSGGGVGSFDLLDGGGGTAAALLSPSRGGGALSLPPMMSNEAVRAVREALEQQVVADMFTSSPLFLRL